MIRSISLGNFQGFKSSQTVPLGPLTLIFGPNSSGKSSIGRALRFIAQAFSSPDRTASFTGPFIDLTHFENVIHGGIISEKINLGIHIDIETESSNYSGREPAEHFLKFDVDSIGYIDNLEISGYSDLFAFEEPGLDWNERPDYSISLHGTLAPTHFNTYKTNQSRDIWETVQGDPYLFGPIPHIFSQSGLSTPTYLKQFTSSSDLSYKPVPHPTLLQRFLAGGLTNFQSSLTSILPEMVERDKESRDGDMAIPLEKDEFNQSRAWIFAVNTFIRGIESTWQETFGCMTFVPSIRQLPAPTEWVETTSHAQIKSFEGEDGQPMVEWEGSLWRNIDNLNQTASAKARIEELSKSLLGLTDGKYSYHEERLLMGDKFQRTVLSRFVKDEERNKFLDFENVGAGIGQIMPIIEAMRSRTVPEGGRSSEIVFIEQPELHLHPAAQARMGEFLALNSQAVDPGNKQVIVETHSENVILRVQRMIRTGVLSHADVTVLYVDTENNETRVRDFKLNDRGEFLEQFPSGFVETRLDEIL